MAIGIVSTPEKTLDLSTAAIGLQVTAPFVLVAKKSGQTKAADAKPYLDLTFKNERGQAISAKIWSEDVPVWKDVDPGTPCMLSGKLEAYPKDAVRPNQIKIQSVDWLEPNHPVVSVMNEHSPISHADLAAEFDSIIGGFKHPGYRRAAELYFTDICERERFLTAPAAKGNHHAYIGGLAEHTFEMRRIAIMTAMQPVIRERVNIDLISFSTLVHDSGKIFEYVWEGQPIGMHPDSILFNHMTTGPMMMSQLMERHGEELAALGFTWEDAKHVIHVIVSHHGKLEYGAPTTPGTLEAQIIHQADMASAAVRKVLTMITNAEPDKYGKYEGSWGAFSHGLRASPPTYEAMRISAQPGDEGYGDAASDSGEFARLPLELRLDQAVAESQTAGESGAFVDASESEAKPRTVKAAR